MFSDGLRKPCERVIRSPSKGSRPTSWEPLLYRLHLFKYGMTHTTTSEWASAVISAAKTRAIVSFLWQNGPVLLTFTSGLFTAHVHIWIYWSRTHHVLQVLIWISFNLFSKIKILVSPCHSKPLVQLHFNFINYNFKFRLQKVIFQR